MKTLRSTLIVLVLTASVRAGDMGNGSPVAPTPTPQTPAVIQPVDETPLVESGGGVTDAATMEAALNLLQAILALI